MGLAQRIKTADRVANRVVIRQNLESRLAGAGYAAITLLWLILMRAQSTPTSVWAEVILIGFTVVGLGVALNRDELVVSRDRRIVVHIQGFLGLQGLTDYAFSDFDRVAIEAGGIVAPGADTSGPYLRRWCSVALVLKQPSRNLRLWTGQSDDSDAGMTRLGVRARNRAEAIARLISLPITD